MFDRPSFNILLFFSVIGGLFLTHEALAQIHLIPTIAGLPPAAEQQRSKNNDSAVGVNGTLAGGHSNQTLPLNVTTLDGNDNQHTKNESIGNLENGNEANLLNGNATDGNRTLNITGGGGEATTTNGTQPPNSLNITTAANPDQQQQTTNASLLSNNGTNNILLPNINGTANGHSHNRTHSISSGGPTTNGTQPQNNSLNITSSTSTNNSSDQPTTNGSLLLNGDDSVKNATTTLPNTTHGNGGNVTETHLGTGGGNQTLGGLQTAGNQALKNSNGTHPTAGVGSTNNQTTIGINGTQPNNATTTTDDFHHRGNNSGFANGIAPGIKINNQTLGVNTTNSTLTSGLKGTTDPHQQQQQAIDDDRGEGPYHNLTASDNGAPNNRTLGIGGKNGSFPTTNDNTLNNNTNIPPMPQNLTNSQQGDNTHPNNITNNPAAAGGNNDIQANNTGGGNNNDQALVSGINEINGANNGSLNNVTASGGPGNEHPSGNNNGSLQPNTTADTGNNQTSSSSHNNGTSVDNNTNHLPSGGGDNHNGPPPKNNNGSTGTADGGKKQPPPPPKNFAVDVYQPVSIDDFECLRKNQYKGVVLRGYHPYANGSLDQALNENLQNARKAGFKRLEVFVRPSPSMEKTGDHQLSELLEATKNNSVALKRVWLMVTDPQAWSRNVPRNIEFIKSFLNKSSADGIQSGIYTNWYDWDVITGGYEGITNDTLLWYWKAKGRNGAGETEPSFKDYQKFGDWDKPAIKQFGVVMDQCGLSVNKDVFQTIKDKDGKEKFRFGRGSVIFEDDPDFTNFSSAEDEEEVIVEATTETPPPTATTTTTTEPPAAGGRPTLEPQYPHQYPDTITIISGSNNTNNTVVQFGGTNVSNTNESANITEENTLIHEENEEGSSAEATNPRRKEVEATRTTTENSIGGTTGRTPGNGPTSERSWSLSSTTEAPEVDVDVKLEEDMASTTEGPFPFSFRFRGTTASGPSPQPRTATEPSTMTSERPPGKHSGEEEIEKSEDGESADGKPIKKITKIREHYSEDGSTKKEEISSNSTEWTSDKTGKPSESSSDNNDNDNNETEEEKEAEKKLPIRPPEFRHNDVDHSAEYHRRNDTTRYVEKETNHNATDAEEKDVQPKVFVRLD